MYDRHSLLSSSMETTMYDEIARNGSGQPSLRDLKRSMTLDFNMAGSGKAKKAKLGTPSGLLASPDLNMLKLASPELERMIIQQNGMVTTTPTPTQFLCPKFVTEEQEAYARGFVDALEELHKKEDPLIPGTVTTTSADGNTQTLALLTNASSNTYAQVQSHEQGQHHYQNLLSSSSTSMGNALPQQSYAHAIPTQVNNVMLPRIKEEPQTVPSISSSPPLSPINMESQERIKLERKRARNRIAARKCRHRKLERISRLEDKIDGLKDRNSSLSDTASELRDQVCRLKQQIMEHVKNGCQVMMSQNLTF